MGISSKVVSAALALLGGAVIWTATDGLVAFTSESARRVKVEKTPVEIAQVSLIDSHGKPRKMRVGKVALVEFIYTTCPTICQTAGEEFFRLRKRLDESVAAGTVQMMSVSFDVANDDREALAAYAKNHGADGRTWSVVKPQADAVSGMLSNFGVKVIPDRFGGYQHNAAIHVVDATGRLSRIVDPDDIDGAVKAVKEVLP